MARTSAKRPTARTLAKRPTVRTMAKQPTARTTDYFAAVAPTDLMRVMVALATEVYALADRAQVLEAALARHGVDLRALDAPTQPAAYDASRRAVRDAFVQRVFGALEQPAPARFARKPVSKPAGKAANQAAKKTGDATIARIKRSRSGR